MATQKYRFAVTQIVEVELNLDKFGPDFLAEFSTMITWVDRPDEVAEHIAYNFAYNGAYDFVEGVGDLAEMGVNVREVGVEVETVDPRDWQEAA